MDPAQDGPGERQHKSQDGAAQKQSPPEDERQLISPSPPPPPPPDSPPPAAAAAGTATSPPLPPPPVERAASPSSTISSGYGPTMGMYPAHDEGLPEVVMPDETPQALSRLEAEYKRKYLEGDSAPQTVIPKDMDTTKIAVAGGSPYEVTPDGTRVDVEGAGTAGKGAEKTILGLRKKTFWILVGIVLALVVAAAVGGGVGGGLASKKDKGGASSVDEAATTSSGAPTSTSPSPSSTTSSSRTSTSSTTSSTSSSPTPTFLNNQTTSANTFAFQAFAANKFLGNATAVIDDEGGTDLGFEAHSYVWLPALTDCCITFCTNATSKGMVGWLCSQRKQPESSDPFRRVYVWCHQKHEKPNAICIDPKT
ncbi:hypothetical protein A9Z42_0026780 [Trichoderma parareesei]|uniref:Uncharacterized protein n=1 Tax=Trichoderma parareesei TaxID=858221 RepID=A0A2H2Z3L3_TRIPA|nr:hypothetical protein A9Z42_0026780 [Trichoderma parareesei]